MCSLCINLHRTHECRKFSTPGQLSKRVVELKLCFLCLKEGHRSKDCKASQCFKCKRRNHPALCSPTNNTGKKVTRNIPANQAIMNCRPLTVCSHYDLWIFSAHKGYAVSPLPIQREEPSTDSHNRDYLLNYWKEGATIADKFWEKVANAIPSNTTQTKRT
ncbi:Zinc knuckle family protein [Brugia pahangi]